MVTEMFVTRKNKSPCFQIHPKVQFETFSMSEKSASQIDSDSATSTLPKVARPSLYKVILLNDDFTPMDFVVLILKKFFNKPDGEAQRIMMAVHKEGSAIAGIYTFEVAETKVYLVNEFS